MTRSWATLRPLPFDAVELDAAGFLGGWQTLNRSVTLPHCIDQLETAGALDNFRRLAGRSTTEYRGLLYQDSDLYKTLEAAAWELGRADDPRLRVFLESTAELLADAQDADGYLSSWFQGVRPELRWKDLAWSHEMYCGGHLIQAAVAAAVSIGHSRLLEVARRFADLLVRRAGPGGQEAIDGHPEIEIALVELARLTGEQAYLELARRMIDLRGRGLLQPARLGPQYFQDHTPVRDAVEVTGHAVRQLYLAAAATDVYLAQGDRSLLLAMQRLWDDAYSRKTYITGGLGSRGNDEAFGEAYDLPPDRAYAETCAAVASFMWNWRMLLATGRAACADQMERALYNAIAVGLSADGTQFAYANPLQVRQSRDHSTGQAHAYRFPWFACACCPTNLTRLVASLQQYVATSDDAGTQLHLYAPGRVRATGPSGPMVLEVRTDYPWDSQVSITIVEGGGRWTLSLRIPAWCESPTISIDGVPGDSRPDVFGYVRLNEAWRSGSTVALDLPMPARVVRAHPYVDAVRGCGALMRGPLVYCLEEGDVDDNASIDDILLEPARPPQPVSATGELSRLAPVVLSGQVQVAATRADQPLYQTATDDAALDIEEGATMRAIPYYRWGNRGPRAMRVWLPLGS